MPQTLVSAVDQCKALASAYRARDAAAVRGYWLKLLELFAALTDGIGSDTWQTLLNNLLRVLFPAPVFSTSRESVDQQWAIDALQDSPSTRGLIGDPWGRLFLWLLQFLLDRVPSAESLTDDQIQPDWEAGLMDPNEYRTQALGFVADADEQEPSPLTISQNKFAKLKYENERLLEDNERLHKSIKEITSELLSSDTESPSPVPEPPPAVRPGPPVQEDTDEPGIDDTDVEDDGG